ncbi:outer membrane beta-barrel protein [Bizionia sediminis]|uniref:Outer membrane beta-barrel protein n=1 Tax=Bizionia sediminis TaxID=1737064 RepID=A0ABW5KUV4_9FLAO
MTLKQTFFIMALACLFSAQIQAQETPHFKVAFGLNIIDNSNETTQAPWGIKDASFSMPIYIGVAYQFNERWELGLNGTFNEMKVPALLPGAFGDKIESNFFALNIDANYYIIASDSRNFIDFYGILGSGFYSAFDGTAMTIQPGLGFNYWFTDNLGANVTAKANFDLGKDIPEVSNFYKYTIGLIYRFY